MTDQTGRLAPASALTLRLRARNDDVPSSGTAAVRLPANHRRRPVSGHTARRGTDQAPHRLVGAARVAGTTSFR